MTGVSMLCRPLNPNLRSPHPRFLLSILLLPSLSRPRALQSPPLPPPSSTLQPISRFISTPAFTTASVPRCNTSIITSCHLLLFVSATASPCTHPNWAIHHLVVSCRLSRTFAWLVFSIDMKKPVTTAQGLYRRHLVLEIRYHS